jgi:hypothetical protein
VVRGGVVTAWHSPAAQGECLRSRSWLSSMGDPVRLIGWTEVRRRAKSRVFVAKVVGLLGMR